jgi:hypothetical protein
LIMLGACMYLLKTYIQFSKNQIRKLSNRG